MGLELAAAAALSLLFVGAGALKLWRPLSFEQGLARRFHVGTGVIRATTRAIATTELAIGLFIALPPTLPAALIAAFAWCIVAMAYQVDQLRSAGSCGCLGGFDPLKMLGPRRWFIYLAPYVLLTVTLLALQVRQDGVVAIALLWSIPLALVLGAAALLSARATQPAFPGDLGRELSRRSFLRRAVALVAAIALLPTLNRLRALADTCGAWSCVRFEVVCICCGCSNNRSCDACYQRRRRTCQGPYGTYVQEQLVTSVCYANICSPCWRSYVSSCGRCCPCPV